MAQGIAVRLPEGKKYGVIIGYDNERYYFSSEDYSANLKISVLDEVTFDPLGAAENRKRNPFRKLAAVRKSENFKIPGEIKGVRLVLPREIFGLKILEQCKSYHICSESRSRDEALEMLADLTRESGCTAVIDVKVRTYFPALSNQLLYIFTGVPVIASGVGPDGAAGPDNGGGTGQPEKPAAARDAADAPSPGEKPVSGHIDIPQERIRIISPNIARRVVQRLCIWIIMLLLFPLIAHLTIVYRSYMAAVLGLLVELSLIVFYHAVNPHGSCCYFKRNGEKKPEPAPSE